MQSKDGIGLAVPKAFRELLLAVRVLGLGLAVLILLGDGSFLGHTVIYSTHNKHTRTNNK